MNSKNLIKSLFMAAFLFSSLFLNAQDWANLKRYQKENADLKTPVKNENRVVFMGNSITQHWKEKDSVFFQINPYICRGISGQTTPQMLIRFRQDVIALQPNVVVILAGTNDIAGNTGPSTLEMILDNLASMTEIAKANHIKVILCSILPAYDYPWRKGLEPNIKIPKMNALIQDYCKKTNTLYLDYFSAMADDKNGMKAELTTDGVHCTPQGYKLMEKMVQEAIGKVLKTR
ncbi:MAG: SGNH/GDSL hydrolase family protein [Paludibacter sp.]|jgi:lysophospholipase L1-like esterase